MVDPMELVDGLMARLSGPMHLRLILQPLMALFFAYRDGRRDARESRPPYFWGLLTGPEHRREMLRSGWKGIGNVFVLAVVLDLIFQYVEFHQFRLHGGALLAGVALALIPYLLIRGPVNRLSQPGAKR